MFMMLKNFKNNFFIALFYFLVFTPITLYCCKKITGKNFDLDFSGYFDKVEKPKFSKENFINRKFQSEFENYFFKKFAPRGFFIKTYNQLQFSFFSKGNRIIGKNNYIYEMAYIADECCLNGLDYNNENKLKEMKDYVEHLVSINEKLNKIGKGLLIYSTPTKAHWFRETIPYKYLIQAKDGKRAIDCFRELVKNTNLNYFDTDSLVRENNYPLFYSTGIHWARPIEQEVSLEIVNRLKMLTGKNIPILQLGEIKKSKTPYWRDADVYDLENLIFKKYDKEEYYEYEMKEILSGNSDEITILLQGGSFSSGVQIDYFNNSVFKNYYYINYNNAIEHNGLWKKFKSDFSDLDLSFFNTIDCVIIEVNEAVISWYSSGFAKFFDNFLDSYISEEL